VIAYIDTSVLIPIVIREPSSDACRRIWDEARLLLSTRLLYVEAAAVLTQAVKVGRLERKTFGRRLERLRELRQDVQWIELDSDLTESAAMFATNFGLRGHDATHCAAGAAIGTEGTVLASGDRRMLEIWSDLGFSTFDPNRSGPG
jgi:hypothetical protein